MGGAITLCTQANSIRQTEPKYKKAAGKLEICLLNEGALAPEAFG